VVKPHRNPRGGAFDLWISTHQPFKLPLLNLPIMTKLVQAKKLRVRPSTYRKEWFPQIQIS